MPISAKEEVLHHEKAKGVARQISNMHSGNSRRLDGTRGGAYIYLPRIVYFLKSRTEAISVRLFLRIQKDFFVGAIGVNMIITDINALHF